MCYFSYHMCFCLRSFDSHLCFLCDITQLILDYILCFCTFHKILARFVWLSFHSCVSVLLFSRQSVRTFTCDRLVTYDNIKWIPEKWCQWKEQYRSTFFVFEKSIGMVFDGKPAWAFRKVFSVATLQKALWCRSWWSKFLSTRQPTLLLLSAGIETWLLLVQRRSEIPSF